MRPLILAAAALVGSACESSPPASEDTGVETIWEVCYSFSDLDEATTYHVECCPQPEIQELGPDQQWEMAARAACLSGSTAGLSAGWNAGEICAGEAPPDVASDAETACASSECTSAQEQARCFQSCAESFITCHDAGWSTAYVQAAEQAGCSR